MDLSVSPVFSVSRTRVTSLTAVPPPPKGRRVIWPRCPLLRRKKKVLPQSAAYRNVHFRRMMITVIIAAWAHKPQSIRGARVRGFQLVEWVNIQSARLPCRPGQPVFTGGPGSRAAGLFLGKHRLLMRGGAEEAQGHSDTCRPPAGASRLQQQHFRRGKPRLQRHDDNLGGGEPEVSALRVFLF